MYDSPIKMIEGAMRMSLENGMAKAVQQAGFYVDKDELAKALMYDRHQYEKGYADAKPKEGEWMGDRCSVCGSERAWYGNNPPYCPDCGSRMRGTDDEV